MGFGVWGYQFSVVKNLKHHSTIVSFTLARAHAGVQRAVVMSILSCPVFTRVSCGCVVMRGKWVLRTVTVLLMGGKAETLLLLLHAVTHAYIVDVEGNHLRSVLCETVVCNALEKQRSPIALTDAPVRRSVWFQDLGPSILLSRPCYW